MESKRMVFGFDELESVRELIGPSRDNIRALLGGKGANLAEMTHIGVPVPPGFTITTEACNSYLTDGNTLPEGLWDQVLSSLKRVESKTGKKFGSPDNPLLLSCRSGAMFSMPGMMDTVLNIGLNPQTAEALTGLTGDPRFVYDTYRRLIQMFGNVVMGIDDQVFESIIAEARGLAGVQNDPQLSAEQWLEVINSFQFAYRSHTTLDFPEDPLDQLQMSIEAVFKSWNGKRAFDYRQAAGIPHDLGTAVSVVSMVFGNLGDDCATGVAMTRNGSTGERALEGDYLINAQGEDVVSGSRQTLDLSTLKDKMPEIYAEFITNAQLLEDHYLDMQDIEFTIEKGKLWMLQTREGKRTAQAAVRIGVEMAEEGLIDRGTAVLRVTPEQVDFFLHPQFSPSSMVKARPIAMGLNVSPGAAVGMAAFDADMAETWAKEQDKQVVMVRPETRPDDVHGILAAQGVLTSRGGRTSHAALVARQFGKPAVVGAADIDIDLNNRQLTIGNLTINEGDWISIDGTTGSVYQGQLETMIPDINDPWLIKLLSWADEFRVLGVRVNADYPRDAQRALDYGAEGIGLCRSEHMFFETNRLPHFRKMIMADYPVERKEALEALLPFQRDDFAGLFRVMDGKPVIIRLIDPPLHEFLPDLVELVEELADLKVRLQHAQDMASLDVLLASIREKERLRLRASTLHESNPMLGLRGVRLGILLPELTIMQVQAIFEAACQVAQEGVDVRPEVMIPLTCHINEISRQRSVLETTAKKVMQLSGVKLDYKFGTMIELPRAAVVADQLARQTDFFSFGTNDLTQTTFGISRDDAEAGFLLRYLETGVFSANPFATLDRDGVGRLIEMAVQKGRSTKPGLECGICGEHGGDPHSIELCHQLGLSYVSCSPFRVPVARLAAAHAALRPPPSEG